MTAAPAAAAAAPDLYEDLWVLSGGLQDPPLLAAGPTPLGRGLAAAAPLPRGAPLVSVPIANALAIADDPFGISVFSDRQQRAWQAAHGPLPEALQEFLTGGGRPRLGAPAAALGGRAAPRGRCRRDCMHRAARGDHRMVPPLH